MGTRFVVAKESIVHENYKQRIIKAKDIDSAVTGRTHGHPVRCLRNQMTREYNRLEAEGKSFEELEYLTLGTLRKSRSGRRYHKWNRHGRSDRRSCNERADMQGNDR